MELTNTAKKALFHLAVFLITALVLIANAGASASGTDPVAPDVDIKANGADGSLILSAGSGFTFDVTVQANDSAGQTGDWWLCVSTPGGWYSYMPDTTWVPGVVSAGQFAISDFSVSIPVPPMGAGIYQAYFGLDNNADGALDATWMDSVGLVLMTASEDTEVRLFAAWDGRRAAAASPADPIVAENFELTSAIMVHDPASNSDHEVTIYFDSTTNENEWEFLVTCPPAEDHRYLASRQQASYGVERYDYTLHKGAGALLYGTISFTPFGDIDRIAAYSVPPDGEVDPARNDNRLVLDNTDYYYSFEANFTGNDTNISIPLSFGARYSGLASLQKQVLVSDGGAVTAAGGTTPITEDSLWSDVYDAGDMGMQSGDQFHFAGYTHSGLAASLTYTVETTKPVKDMLGQIETAFGCNASIDASGRLRLEDVMGGDSAFYITDFITLASSGARPFTSATYDTGYGWAISPGAALDNGGTPITDTASLLTSIYDADGEQMAASDVITFSGNAVDGGAVNATFTINPGSIIQDLLNFIKRTYDAGSGTISVSLDTNGCIRVWDLTSDGADLLITLAMTTSANDSDPFGEGATAATPFTGGHLTSSNVNITTAKRQLLSHGRALSTDTGLPPVITADTAWSSVFDGAGGRAHSGDVLIFAGTKGDGSTVSFTYTVPSGATTVRGLLDELEVQFDVMAGIDNAGRLVMTDQQSGPSLLAVTSVTYGIGRPQIFGANGYPFEYIDADSTEDGSQAGDLVSTDFIGEGIAGAW